MRKKVSLSQASIKISLMLCRDCYARATGPEGWKAVDEMYRMRRERSNARMVRLLEGLRAEMPAQVAEVDMASLANIYQQAQTGWFIGLHVKDGTCWLGRGIVEAGGLRSEICGRISHEAALRIADQDQYSDLRIRRVAENGWQLRRAMRDIVYRAGDTPCMCRAERYRDVTGAWQILCTGAEAPLPDRVALKADFRRCAEQFARAFEALSVTPDLRQTSAILYAHLHGLLKPWQLWEPMSSRSALLFRKDYKVSNTYFPYRLELYLAPQKEDAELLCSIYSLNSHDGGGCGQTIAKGDEMLMMSPVELMERHEEAITGFCRSIVPSFSMREELEAMKAEA